VRTRLASLLLCVLLALVLVSLAIIVVAERLAAVSFATLVRFLSRVRALVTFLAVLSGEGGMALRTEIICFSLSPLFASLHHCISCNDVLS